MDWSQVVGLTRIIISLSAGSEGVRSAADDTRPPVRERSTGSSAQTPRRPVQNQRRPQDDEGMVQCIAPQCNKSSILYRVRRDRGASPGSYAEQR
jgi:hypothetical protein